MKLFKALALGGALAGLLAVPSMAETTLTGAVQFNEDHAFTKALRKFEQEASACSNGSLKFDLHMNSELGLEKDYFENMSQGIAVDYAIVSPSHMSTFSQKAPLMDMPFLFRDLDHWNAVMEQDALAPLAQDVLEKANVRLIGYAGGGTRLHTAATPGRDTAHGTRTHCSYTTLHTRSYGETVWVFTLPRRIWAWGFSVEPRRSCIAHDLLKCQNQTFNTKQPVIQIENGTKPNEMIDLPIT